MNAPSYIVMDEVLQMLSVYGPDLSNGLTSHAPMATEALCALGRPDAVMPWVERYRHGLLPRPSAREQIDGTKWGDALGQWDRFGDWSAFFTDELQNAPWRAVLDRWVGRLAPGICASATHGVIRVGHAVRSLAEADVERRTQSGRLNELADALASWAYAYQELPTSPHVAERTMPPREAITKVAVVPPEQRQFSGTITSSLYALSEFPSFAPVIGLLDVGGDVSRLVPELTDVFARVYLANTHDVLTAIVFIHGVTSVAALGNMLPHLADTTARTALRFAWQAGCGLYAAFGSHPTPAGEIEPARDDADTLVDMAIAHGDEHAIKFTAACLQQHALHPSPAYLAAARNALHVLPRT
jgi:hypothetical protein